MSDFDSQSYTCKPVSNRYTCTTCMWSYYESNLNAVYCNPSTRGVVLKRSGGRLKQDLDKDFKTI